jgi:mono/diheme cytochrome c family protein
MTDQPGQPPEERLPAPRPSSAPVPAERFSSPPSAHRNDLTPERAGRIVRQSANARWVGFLAVTVVSLFVIGYYFWELGIPGVTTPRLEQASAAQQVTAVERGYNLYQANCAQCHGATGLGNEDPENPGEGPALNRDDKLFAHLNPDYLRNVLTVGGRYVCGNPNSRMPVWSNEGNPPGPLNYKQVDDLIAFIRAPEDEEFRVMDPELFEPELNEAGEEETFHGWVNPDWTPAPGSTPFPACWTDALAVAPSASAGTGEPSGDVVEEAAENLEFVNKQLIAPSEEDFQIAFDNRDSAPHNIQINDASGVTLFQGALVNGGEQTVYAVAALDKGVYPFICTVHPNMTGTIAVGG